MSLPGRGGGLFARRGDGVLDVVLHRARGQVRQQARGLLGARHADRPPHHHGRLLLLLPLLHQARTPHATPKCTHSHIPRPHLGVATRAHARTHSRHTHSNVTQTRVRAHKRAFYRRRRPRASSKRREPESPPTTTGRASIIIIIVIARCDSRARYTGYRVPHQHVPHLSSAARERESRNARDITLQYNSAPSGRRAVKCRTLRPRIWDLV